MQKAVTWKVLKPDEVKNLKFASSTGRNSPYKELFAAVEQGPVKVDIPQGSNLQALKWRLGRAIKKEGANIEIATLEDKSGVVLTKGEEESANE